MFTVKVTAKAYIIRIWLFLLYLLNCWLLCNQTWFDSTALWVGVSCRKMGWLRSRSRSKQRFRMSVDVCLDDILWITEHFVTKFGSDAASWARVMGTFCCCCYLQRQDHSKGSYDQIMTLSTILSELLIPWQPNLVWWYIIRSQSVLWKELLHSGLRSQRRAKI